MIFCLPDGDRDPTRYEKDERQQPHAALACTVYPAPGLLRTPTPPRFLPGLHPRQVVANAAKDNGFETPTGGLVKGINTDMFGIVQVAVDMYDDIEFCFSDGLEPLYSPPRDKGENDSKQALGGKRGAF